MKSRRILIMALATVAALALPLLSVLSPPNPDAKAQSAGGPEVCGQGDAIFHACFVVDSIFESGNYMGFYAQKIRGKVTGYYRMQFEFKYDNVNPEFIPPGEVEFALEEQRMIRVCRSMIRKAMYQPNKYEFGFVTNLFDEDLYDAASPGEAVMPFLPSECTLFRKAPN